MTANGNTWSASIPSFVVSPPSVQYYLRATDTPGNTASYPASGAAGPDPVHRHRHDRRHDRAEHRP